MASTDAYTVKTPAPLLMETICIATGQKMKLQSAGVTDRYCKMLKWPLGHTLVYVHVLMIVNKRGQGARGPK